ncbi:glycosyltransferase [Aequorivita sediminis]|uniref:glycosyltransferase n=1 Tax=Aequorivita sediminis TaxID=3073653 RepID=UPI0028A5A7BA|nr:glycosyltransferase [Aequorivita sp. F6058]
MVKKKKLLFVIESLTLAGSEKSLIALLTNLDSDLYDIDLQLFKYGGELERFLPKYVNLLSPLPYTLFARKSFARNLKSFNIKFIKAKITYSLGLRLQKRNHTEIAKLYWKSVKHAFEVQDMKYDVAIAYAQGVPTFYVMDKIKATKKVTWVNANVQFTNYNKSFQKSYYDRYNYIVPVSKVNQEHFTNIFPDLSKKLWLIQDMIDYVNIGEMANLFKPEFKKDTFNLLTVSRLEKGMKGLDITIETCRILRDKEIDFHWYILGKGSFRPEIENYIKINKLEKHLTLLGTSANPYPYFKAADLYVQTSRSESFGISIAEARLLNTPVVTTRFDTVFMQMVDGKNGLVADMNAEAVAEAIIKIIDDNELYNSIVEYLKNEPKVNTETIKRFNAMIKNFISNN